MLLCLSGFSQAPQAIVGKWKGKDEPSRQTEFYQNKNGSFSGKIINDTSKSPKNGFLIFKELKYDDRSHTFIGKMTPPDKNIEIDATVSFIGKDELLIVGKMLLFTKTTTFLRIK
jgi:hypothetical protein